MAPFKQNHTIYRGADFDFECLWEAGDTEATVTPVDLTGATARMHVRPEIDSSVIYLTLTTENGGITLGGALGTIALHLSAADTTPLTWEEAVYDLEIVFPDGRVRRFMAGKIKTSPEVTR